MKRKIALKQLTRSDLTIFDYHFKHIGAGNQKSINLNADVFIKSIYPQLNQLAAEGGIDTFLLNLTVLGPGFEGAHVLPQKITKKGTYKNWRLNGKVIPNPDNSPDRYNCLQADDYAILEFDGVAEPTAVKMILVAQSIPDDQPLHDAIKKAYRGRSMAILDIGALENIAEQTRTLLPADHPIFDLLEESDLEDAAQGGFVATKKLGARRRSREVSREELAKAKLNAERVGRLGEEILNAWLGAEMQAGKGPAYCWDSDSNAVAPYDFTLLDGPKAARRIDAKSTAGEFRNTIHVSMAELDEMANGGVPYDIYRLYSVNESTARLRVVRNLGKFAWSVLNEFAELPVGVAVDNVSISPEILDFGEEIIIDFLTGDGDENQEAGDFQTD